MAIITCVTRLQWDFVTTLLCLWIPNDKVVSMYFIFWLKINYYLTNSSFCSMQLTRTISMFHAAHISKICPPPPPCFNPFDISTHSTTSDIAWCQLQIIRLYVQLHLPSLVALLLSGPRVWWSKCEQCFATLKLKHCVCCIEILFLVSDFRHIDWWLCRTVGFKYLLFNPTEIMKIL